MFNFFGYSVPRDTISQMRSLSVNDILLLAVSINFVLQSVAGLSVGSGRCPCPN